MKKFAVKPLFGMLLGALVATAAVAATSVPQEKFVVFVEEYENDAIGIGGRTLKAIKAAQ